MMAYCYPQLLADMRLLRWPETPQKQESPDYAMFDYYWWFGKGGDLVLVVDETAVAHERLEIELRQSWFLHEWRDSDVSHRYRSREISYPHDFR